MTILPHLGVIVRGIPFYSDSATFLPRQTRGDSRELSIRRIATIRVSRRDALSEMFVIGISRGSLVLSGLLRGTSAFIVPFQCVSVKRTALPRETLRESRTINELLHLRPGEAAFPMTRGVRCARVWLYEFSQENFQFRLSRETGQRDQVVRRRKNFVCVIASSSDACFARINSGNVMPSF